MGKRFHLPVVGGLAIGSLLLSSCVERASHSRSSASSQSAPVVPVAAPDYEALWHLRVGLNVAALMCSGHRRAPMQDEYGQMLHIHRDVLATSYNYEVQRYGRDGNDRHQTQLYNRFANQADPGRWCLTAKRVADQALRMDSLLLSRSASGLLTELSGGAAVASVR
jgi:hypothetical protein